MPPEYFEEEDFQTQFSGQTLKRIISLARPHWKTVFGFLFCVTLVSVLEAYFTYLSKQIIDVGIIGRNIPHLNQILITYGLLTIVSSLGVFGFIYLVGVLGERIRYDLRRAMFNHLQSLSLSYYSRTPIGWIMSRVTSDSDRVAELVTWGTLDITWATVNISTALFFMFIINWQLALIILAFLPIMIIAAVEFRKRILKEYRKVRKYNSQITGSYNENITGVRVVKALSREKQNLDEFSQLTGNMYTASFRAAWLSALFLPVIQLISAFAIGGIVWYGGWSVQIGALTIGGIQAFVSYITMMMWPVQDFARVFAQMQRSIASAERIFSLIDAVPEIQDKKGAADPGSLRKDIVFKDVSFHYGDNNLVINNLNLHIKPGETIALVGPTGGGKSTIVNLLCRFYEPTHGTIHIGEQEYTTLSLHAIQSRIGMVLQTPHLFSGTIRENIAYGRLEAAKEDIEATAKLVGAHDFIIQFNKGYDEPVGEGGSLLSVGQKQLISLARAFLAKPDIFIMDEATSSVDTITEALIQKSTHTLMAECTSIIIAHRLSTIKRADRILVIENGQIAEIGSHAELLKLQGKYYNLYTKQFRLQAESQFDPYTKNLKHQEQSSSI